MAQTVILYACPTGPLTHQIEQYWTEAIAQCGPNAAHQYMPHCSLTGFFHDDGSAIPTYLVELETLLTTFRETQPDPVIQVERLEIQSDFHGLILSCPWLLELVKAFAAQSQSTTRQDPIRLKTWPHLSLAYNFEPDHHDKLAHLARTYIDITAPVSWELRFYERRETGSWHCHQAWPLS